MEVSSYDHNYQEFFLEKKIIGLGALGDDVVG